MGDSPKFCRDCIHFYAKREPGLFWTKKNSGFGRCLHPLISVDATAYLVSGDPNDSQTCWDSRFRDTGLCGKDAKLFEPRVHPMGNA